jgi:hypothetical protein
VVSEEDDEGAVDREASNKIKLQRANETGTLIKDYKEEAITFFGTYYMERNRLNKQ